MVDEIVFALGGMEVVSWNLAMGSYEEDHGARRAVFDESLEIVKVADDCYACTLDS
jgi:hypothetical protein